VTKSPYDDRYTLNLYRQEMKKEAPADVNDPDWVRWRVNKITAFMSKLSKITYSLWGYGSELASDRQKEIQYLFRNPEPRLANRN